MKNTIYIKVFILLLWLCACESKKETVLFNDVADINLNSGKITLSELMTDSIHLVPLELTDESIIGRINKIKKHNGDYYVLSDDRSIMKFDKEGKFQISLNKRGAGPDEYSFIQDFDICINSNIAELWISDNYKIKIYNLDDFAFIRDITFPVIVNKFRQIDNENTLIMSGQTKESLMVCDEKGNIKESYLKKEVPYLLFKAIQFKKYNKFVLFQLGVSNDFISYNLENKSFNDGRFLSSDANVMSKGNLRNLYEEYGQDFIVYLNTFKNVKSFSAIDNIMWLFIQEEGSSCIAKIKDGKLIASSNIKNNANVINNLFDLNDVRFLNTIGFGESDDSLLLFLDISFLASDTLDINMNNGLSYTFNIEDNPCLVEFYAKK